MAREARKLSSKGLYYIELKGDTLFKTEDDKKRFLEIANEYFGKGGKIYGYSLTKTSIKMVVKESEKGISMTMKPITVSYARYFNKTHGGEGSIFADRFKSIPYESKKEVDEAVLALDKGDELPKAKKAAPKKVVKKAAPKKAEAKKAAPKQEVKKTVPKKAEPKKTEAKAVDEAKPEVKKETAEQKRKKLPTWLL